MKLDDYLIMSALAEQNYVAAVAVLAQHFELPANVRQELEDFCQRRRYVISYGMASPFFKLSRQVAVRCCGHKYYWAERAGFGADIFDPPGADAISISIFAP